MIKAGKALSPVKQAAARVLVRLGLPSYFVENDRLITLEKAPDWFSLRLVTLQGFGTILYINARLLDLDRFE
jgi:hypothetical protein